MPVDILDAVDEMDQDIANALFEKGAILLFLDAPQNLEFGIDCYSWTTGPKFKGLKLIPPGMHFVYYSALNRYGEGAARTGFFKNFKPREVYGACTQKLSRAFPTVAAEHHRWSLKDGTQLQKIFTLTMK